MLKVLVAIVVAIALIGGVIALLGSRLPVGHVATRSVVINAPVESVSAVVTDFAGAPAWRSDLKAVEVTTDPASGRPRITEVSSSGRLTMQVEVSLPPWRLVTRIVGDGLPFGGAWAYDLAPQGTSTRVTITEHGEVYNPVFRFVSRYILGHATTLETYLTNLGHRFGQAVTPADAAPVPLK